MAILSQLKQITLEITIKSKDKALSLQEYTKV